MSAKVNRRDLLLGLIWSFAAASSAANFCSSREFSRDVSTQSSNKSCPYFVNAELWRPGQSSKMELMHSDDVPLQTFLVSVQMGNSLIGHMVPEDNITMVTCSNTSVKHSDRRNKSSVEFLWYAPPDLSSSAEVIVRMSVGNGDTFWKDCEVFYLERGEDFTDSGLPSGPATLTASSTEPTTRRLAGPDLANDRTTSRLAPPDSANQGSTSTDRPLSSSSDLKHRTLSSTQCSEAGNLYSVVIGVNCKQFQQSVGGRVFTFDCPPTTRFDVRKCACSYMSDCDV